MGVARVVSFDGVDAERLAAMVGEMEGGEGGAPPDVPAKGIVVLHDADASRALVVLFFDSEDDYSRGDAALSAMPADETPGRRSSVEKYEVAFTMFT
jgi:hypothetical protein